MELEKFIQQLNEAKFGRYNEKDFGLKLSKEFKKETLPDIKRTKGFDRLKRFEKVAIVNAAHEAEAPAYKVKRIIRTYDKAKRSGAAFINVDNPMLQKGKDTTMRDLKSFARSLRGVDKVYIQPKRKQITV